MALGRVVASGFLRRSIARSSSAVVAAALWEGAGGGWTVMKVLLHPIHTLQPIMLSLDSIRSAVHSVENGQV